jgi:hypothetical protein
MVRIANGFGMDIEAYGRSLTAQLLPEVSKAFPGIVITFH